MGQVSGRRRRSVIDWLNQRSQAFRDAIQVVALDPSAPYASAVRAVLPHARVAVDPFHLVLLANKTVTAVRQRVTGDQLDRCGRAADPVWAHRRLLRRGRQRLSEAAFARMWNGCMDADPARADPGRLDRQRGTARPLLALAGGTATRHEIAHRHHRFFTWCATFAHIPEIATLAQTIDPWWPETLCAIQTGITNAGTEGVNRLIKQVKRSACGFRNRDHYRDRVRLHTIRRGRPAPAARNWRLPT